MRYGFLANSKRDKTFNRNTNNSIELGRTSPKETIYFKAYFRRTTGLNVHFLTAKLSRFFGSADNFKNWHLAFDHFLGDDDLFHGFG